MKRLRAVAVLTVAMLFMLCACGKTEMEQNTGSQRGSTSEGRENFVLIPGGSCEKGKV